MNINSDSGWLTENKIGKTVDISAADIEDLLLLAEQEDQWADNVRREVGQYDQHPHGSGMDIFINQFRIMNTGGTMIQFPFGYVCTFPSRKHLFRGEVMDYPHSESSLSRRCRDKNGHKRAKHEREILHVIANMRIIQFKKFIWQFDIIPQWEGKLSDVNFKALAQHYGFETFLMDLTNDIRRALFFATCKWVNDHFEPLTKGDIESHAESKYGVIYHAPCWWIDFINCFTGGKQLSIYEEMRKRNKPCVIDSGICDGMAYQIGLQPLARVHSQFGYVYPMKTLDDIKLSGQFERLRFCHTIELSRRMYEMMDGGKKLYPDEGVFYVFDVFRQMQKNLVFSENDLSLAYESEEADKSVFPSLDDLRIALLSEDTDNLIRDAYNVPGHVVIQSEEIFYHISREVKEKVNSMYNDRPFLDSVGGVLHDTQDSRAYRRERYKQIFGEYPK